MIKLLLLLLAYLIGAIPFGYLLVRLKTGRDVRSMGSGNIGATNVLRTAGRGVGVLTLLLDILKGYFAVWLMGHFAGDSPLWLSAAALAVMIGHSFPIFLKFHGGKAVASFLGAFLYLTPVPLMAVLAVFLIAVAVTRYVSFGSVLAAGTFPFAVFLILHPDWPILGAALVAGSLIVYRHRTNLERIRSGTEHRFRFGGK